MRPTTGPTTRGPIRIPWGSGETIGLALPPDWAEVEVVGPDLDGAIADYPGALAAALDHPEGGLRLDALAGPGASVAIVVDDPSRWTPVREALPVVLERLGAAGVRDADITISAGVGRHHAVDDAAMRRRVGDAVVDRFRWFSPPVDTRSEYVDLGDTSEGVPIRVFRPVAEADLRILIGSVLPHLQAGFGGGYKLIFPGCSHRSTLGALHRTGLGGGSDAGRLLGGDPATNPMRRAIGEAAGRLGPCVSISHLLGPPGVVLDVAAGHPDPVQARLSEGARRRFRAPEAPRADAIIAGNAPWPGDPMQSFKVLLHHRAGSRPGGVLVGLFWTDPEEIDRSFPKSALRAIAATGPVGGLAIRKGLAVADRLASRLESPASFMIRWARELVVDRTVLVYAPPLFDRIGPRLGPVRIFRDLDALWEAVGGSLPGVGGPRVRVFPWGGLTYCAGGT